MQVYVFFVLIFAWVALNQAYESTKKNRDLGEIFVKRFKRDAGQRTQKRTDGMVPVNASRPYRRPNNNRLKNRRKAAPRAKVTSASQFEKHSSKNGRQTNKKRKSKSYKPRNKAHKSQIVRGKSAAPKRNLNHVESNQMLENTRTIIGRQYGSSKKEPGRKKIYGGEINKSVSSVYCKHPAKGCVKRSTLRPISESICAKEAKSKTLSMCRNSATKNIGRNKKRGTKARTSNTSKNRRRLHKAEKRRPQLDSPSENGEDTNGKNEISTKYCIENKKGDICILIEMMNDVDYRWCEKEARVKKVENCQNVKHKIERTIDKTIKTTPRTTKKGGVRDLTPKPLAKIERTTIKPTRTKPRTTKKVKTINPKPVVSRRWRKKGDGGFQKDESDDDNPTSETLTSAEKSEEVMIRKTNPENDKAVYGFLEDNKLLCTFNLASSPYYGQCYELDEYVMALENTKLETLAYSIDWNKGTNMFWRLLEKSKRSAHRAVEKLNKGKQLLTNQEINLQTVLGLAMMSAHEPPCTYTAESVPLRDEIFRDIVKDCDYWEDEMDETTE